jgi:16S rRNA (cytosine967-C5)-methyltransferase
LRQRVAADHTVVHQAVEAAQALSVQHAAGFINAVLRKFLRGRDSLEVAPADPGTRLGYPPWWVARMLKSYPDRWEALLSLGNEHPPMTLRVNARRVSRDDYLAKLKEAKVDATPIGRDGILLARPCPVAELPGFAQGYVSVQDEGAQRAAYFLDVRPGMSVLDACAAPGGKACHVLEQVDCELVAMELSAERARRIEENLARLGLRARVVVGDARQVAQGLPDCQYDRVMLDAPCTASGVVRRHPDLRWLRRQADLVGFARMQKQLLEALWPRVRPGGKLLYATCSLFPEENGDQVVAFLARHSEATREPLPDGEDGQLLPTHDHDGFYYALLRKDR